MSKPKEHTLKILAMPNTMTNREVADALDLELSVVKDTRRNHKIEYPSIPKDRGYKAKILAMKDSKTVHEIAAEIGCTFRYVHAVIFAAKKEAITDGNISV